MAGKCVQRMKHDVPNCKSTSGKSLQVFLNADNTFSGFCFACGVKVEDPYGDNPPDPKEIKVKTPEEVQEELNDIRAAAYIKFQWRGIDPDDWQYYGVRCLLSEYDGKTPYASAFPYTRGGKIVRFKTKLMSKKVMWGVGENTDVDLFGWERAKRISGGSLYITEGEEDAIALRKMLRMMSTNSSYDYAVVSLPDGSESARPALQRQMKEINARFKQVVLCFDDDAPGHKAVQEAKKVFPLAKVATLPAKDANACLLAGLARQVRDACVFNTTSDSASAQFVLTAKDLMDKILQEPEWGALYPWDELNELTYGQRFGELISVGGGTGCGKTLIAHELMAWNIVTHDWKILAIMLEETPEETYQNVAGKIDNVPYHVPLADGETPRNKQVLANTVHRIASNLDVWDITTVEDSETTWNQIQDVLRVSGDKYDMVVIDNATVLSEGLSSSDRNDFLGKVNAEFVKLAKKFNFMAMMFSHLNAPGPHQRSHENGGRVLESQFTGTRAAMRYSHMIFGFERNKSAIDPDCSYFVVLKNRKFGRTGRFKTYYTKRTGRLTPRNWDDESYKDSPIATK
ncbi:DNA primase/helicase [Shewanella phage SppYZU05]|uniref:Primase helicase n=1 Tax=Shewanella phage SppYZU05 TaxID=1970795 RepID=A0A1W6JTG5_9CAUD|nr:DNA primase/helicase [Shewanella phage SppYZU05]ARM70562.1 primase helicase [Shewanella phage SppYZU05]